ncbi:MAG: eukaryotic-like serine/threonine-protein kinase [Acidimicrobiaceae bacterium]
MLATETVLSGRYRLGPIIGRGGGADVHRADDLETGRPVAIKVLRAVSPDDLHRFEQEGQTLARLDHPAIVRMCGGGEQDGIPYLVLDLIDGEPLSAVLLRGPLEEPEVARIGGVLADALAHAHEIGVVHRDVKPGNVLFDRSGDVHLTDFGIARLTDVTAITATGFVIGTAAYLAPEQVNGDPATPASDIYALGLVLLEALTGERAYQGSASEAALARLHRQPEIPPTADRSLAALLGAMTASDPSVRPTAAAVAEAITVRAGEPPADATALLPVAGDVTTTVPLAGASAAAAAASGAPTAVVATTGAAAAGTAASATAVARPRKFDARRVPVTVIAAALIALVLIVGLAIGGNQGGGLPADAQTSTTVAPTSAPAPVVAETVPPTTAPPRKGGKKHDGGDG